MKLVPYYRCSTQKQARSGLGLEGQEATVMRFAAAHAADVLKSYVEVETGKSAERPELAKAVAHARRAKATLVIAKLDRLARNVHFLSGLMEAGVKFVACDQPSANDLTIHILAAVAQDEAKRISERTKAALAAYKARGGKLGAALPECRNLTPDASRMGAEAAGRVAKQEADTAYTDLYPIMKELRDQGCSLRAIAKHLNDEGYETRRGCRWNHVQVRAVLNRYERR
ncbi:MAG: recombinase family protein [Planctomycetaceae bacterium]|nr:recombinase family protein [Planctomycetaceae bacterium]